MPTQERSPSLENKGKVRKLVLQYEEKIKGDAKKTRNRKLDKEDCLGIRRNPIREAKEVALARIVGIQKLERSKNEKEIISRIKRQDDKLQEGIVNDLVRKLEKTQKMLNQERSPSLENKERLRYHVMKYEEMMRNDAQNNENRKQKADLEGKSQDERKHLRREAKEVALIRIRQIAQDEISQKKSDIVYAPVQLWEEALKDEKTEKKQKVYLEEIEEEIVERRIQYFENIIRENMKEEGDLRENIIRGNIKEEGDFRGQSSDLRKNLKRKAKDIALARITQIIQEELSEEQNENIWRSENSEKELKYYQEANSPGTEGDFASKGDGYEEIIKVRVMGGKQKADLEGKFQDERKHLRREAKEVALIRIRQIAQDEISQEKSDIVYAPVQLWEEALKDEKTEKKQKLNLKEIEEGIVETQPLHSPQTWNTEDIAPRDRLFQKQENSHTVAIFKRKKESHRCTTFQGPLTRLPTANPHATRTALEAPGTQGITGTLLPDRERETALCDVERFIKRVVKWYLEEEGKAYVPI
ncbi:golgin subfamily A member 6-like protein 22 [Palaemon carinicauda]|uniref:golgin subfamily A member 6-like protein 22 n=1 Tax=Palaemon carinicauda TaxID=392227 RepID=UPI0035B642A1